jgi:hypothetical protein
MRLLSKAGLVGLSLIVGAGLSIAPVDQASAKGNKAGKGFQGGRKGRA